MATQALADAEEWAKSQLARFVIAKADYDYVFATLVEAHLFEENVQDLQCHISTINEKIEVTISGYTKRFSFSRMTKTFLVKTRKPLLGHIVDVQEKPVGEGEKGPSLYTFYIEKMKLQGENAGAASAPAPKKHNPAYARKRFE